jgi:hypothetical protein
MDAAGARKRMRRLTTLIDGLTKEADAVLGDRGVLKPGEWTRYLSGIRNAKYAQHEVLEAPRMAVRL